MQTPHETETASERDVLLLSTGINRSYPADTSFLLPSGANLSEKNPISTLNEGTPEFASPVVASLVERFQFDELFKQHGPGSSPKKCDHSRGNKTFNYGVASGKNVGVPDESKKVLERYGATTPCCDRREVRKTAP